jgi:thiamine biosynthesis lipoprotein ApbE
VTFHPHQCRCDRLSPNIGRTRTRVPIVDRAVSNSGDYGLCFGQKKRFNHLFNPANSGCADFYPSDLGVCGLAFSDP